MRQLSKVHTLPCSRETFWSLLLDEAYFKAFMLDELGFHSVQVLELNADSRRLRVVPKLTMPGPVMKLLGESFGYEEQATLDRDAGRWSWKVLPNTLKNKLTIAGDTVAQEGQDGTCRCTMQAQVQAKVLGIGRLIEGSTEKEMYAAWDQDAAFMARWLREHP